jgi:hypothetical protein
MKNRKPKCYIHEKNHMQDLKASINEIELKNQDLKLKLKDLEDDKNDSIALIDKNKEQLREASADDS